MATHCILKASFLSLPHMIKQNRRKKTFLNKRKTAWVYTNPTKSFKDGSLCRFVLSFR